MQCITGSLAEALAKQMLFWGQDTGAVPAGDIQRFVVALQELAEIRRTKNNG
jgi:hypothetical protein